MKPETQTYATARARRRRLVAVLVLVFGIIGMHSLAVVPGHETEHLPAVHASASVPVVAPADACDCTGHNGFHACVFILTAMLAMTALALLCWIGAGDDLGVPPRIRELLRRRQRAPPWTVLTLAEMSLLRI